MAEAPLRLAVWSTGGIGLAATNAADAFDIPLTVPTGAVVSS